MNDIEKAIDLLKTRYVKSCKMVNGRLVGGHVDETDTVNIAINTAISVLEKQTSKKLELVFSPYGHEIYFCPSCQENVNKDDWYCSQCGQKLDWSEDKDE